MPAPAPAPTTTLMEVTQVGEWLWGRVVACRRERERERERARSSHHHVPLPASSLLQAAAEAVKAQEAAEAAGADAEEVARRKQVGVGGVVDIQGVDWLRP